MAEFPLPVLQIWRSRKRVAIQIQLMNIHVSECKYYCLHLVPKFGDMCDRQNWRLHPTAAVFALRIWNFPDIRTSTLEQLGGPNKNLPDRRIFLKYLNPFPFLLILLILLFSYVVYSCLCLCKFINKVDYTTSLWHLSLFWDLSTLHLLISIPRWITVMTYQKCDF